MRTSAKFKGSNYVFTFFHIMENQWPLVHQEIFTKSIANYYDKLCSVNNFHNGFGKMWQGAYASFYKTGKVLSYREIK